MYTDKQLAAQAEIKIDQLSSKDWNESNVRAILSQYPTASVLRIAIDQCKFAGIFTAGHQLKDWAFAEVDSR